MDPVAQALAAQLELDPENWPIRAHLAEHFDRQGRHADATKILVDAPGLPADPQHLALGARLLAGTRPDVAMQFLQRLSTPAPTPAAPPPAAPPPAAPVPVRPVAAMAPPPALQVSDDESYESHSSHEPHAEPGPEPASVLLHEAPGFDPNAPIHTVDAKRPRRRMSRSVLSMSIAIHVVLLLVAAYWVVAHLFPPAKKLDFTAEKPSLSANHKPGDNEVKLAKKKSVGGSPPNAKRISTTAASKITIADSPISPITDFQPGMMSGIGGLGNGWGTGIGNGGGGGGGGGGGRIKFFGFEGDATNIYLVLDTSGSMRKNCGGDKGIEKLRDEIARTIQSLSAVSLFNIICFGNQADACFPQSVRATKESKDTAIEFMKGYYSEGGFRTRTEKYGDKGVDDAGIKYTPLTVDKVKGLEGTSGSSRMDLAVVAAMERNASTIFLLSDGQPNPARNGEPMKEEEILKIITENRDRIYKSKSVVINTIYTNTDKSEEGFMKKISGRFKGNHKMVPLD